MTATLVTPSKYIMSLINLQRPVSFACPGNLSPNNLYCCHEVNGNSFTNRSVVIFAGNPIAALKVAKRKGFIAPVISAVASGDSNVAQQQLQAERRAFNNNYKPAEKRDYYGDGYLNYTY